MKTKVIQAVNEPEVPAEIIAQSILEIANAMQIINQSRLKRSTVITLIHDKSKLAKRDIEIVLNNLLDLERDWLKGD